MSPIAYGGAALSAPRIDFPLVEVKPDWSASWTAAPELVPLRALAAAGGQDLGTLELERRYGLVKEPWATAISARGPVNLDGFYVRVRLVGEAGGRTIWTGRISGEEKRIHGGVDGAAGVQRFVAYEPLRQLQKTAVSTSWWVEDGGLVELDWTPSFNALDRDRVLVGNRAAATPDDLGAFGGRELWSNLQAVEYVLGRYVSAAGGPPWGILGQADVLAGIFETIPLGTAQTAADVLRALIPTRLGLDFAVLADDSGFYVYVYALRSDEAVFGAAVLPGNPNRVELDVNSDPFVDPVVSYSEDHRAAAIRVLGRRAVLALTLSADDGTLEPRWSAAAETAYKAGTGTPADAPELHDAARSGGADPTVYAQFGAPQGFDFRGGVSAPLLDFDGQLDGSSVAPYQTRDRRTESWLPIRLGVDYTTNPPTVNAPQGVEPELRSPEVWLFDAELERYVRAEDVDVGVYAARNDWGVLLAAFPRHLLAKGRWTGAAPTNTPPRYDPARIHATIAVEMDQRLVLAAERVGGPAEDGIVDVELADAEAWILAPSTVVGVDASGAVARSPSSPVMLRSDLERLELVAAGAIARYLAGRVRARVAVRGLFALSDLLGSMLLSVVEGGDFNTVDAPITGIEYVFAGGGTTTILAGFAQ